MLGYRFAVRIVARERIGLAMQQIEARAACDTVTVVLAREIDVASVGQLEEAGRQAISDAHGRLVVLDAAGVTFIDSTGLGHWSR
jgi:anti-anti-sigma factor